MPQRLTIRRYNPATGNLDVIGPDKQADQQTPDHRGTTRTMPQGPPEGHAAASEDLSDSDCLELGQSPPVSHQSEFSEQSEDDTADEGSDSGTDEQLSPAEVKIKETFLRRGSTLDRKFLELHKLTGSVYSFIIAVEVPGPNNTKKLMHMVAGTPALKALLVQSDGELHRSTLAAVCSDMDGDSAIAE